MINGSVLLLFSAAVAVFATLLVISIFRKVYQEDYRKPWLFIGVSTIFLALSQILRFLENFYNFVINNTLLTTYIIHILEFISIAILAYGILLEYLILKYYKGKFVKMKFLPVQEGTLGGELDINVSPGNAYLTVKKDPKFMLEEFSMATRKGFEGFLLTEQNPRQVRLKYGIQKTPIAWIVQLGENFDSKYIKESLDENSDSVDPLQLNNLISYIDNFLEQAQSPFIVLDLNLISKTNNFSIVLEFTKYVSSRVEKYNGILIGMLNMDVLQRSEISEIKEVMRELN